MKERRVSSRNFWGGFWGGGIGLLSFYYIHPATIPVACLGGVLVGFWYREIWRLFLVSFPRISAMAQELSRQFHEHPMHAGVLIAGLARFVYVGSTFWLTVRAVGLDAHPKPNQPDGFYLLGILVLMFFGIGIIFVATVIAEESILMGDEYAALRNFYRRWEIYSNRGGWVLFAYCLWSNLAATIPALVLITAFLSRRLLKFTAGALAVGGIVFVKGVYVLSTRQEHWLCLTVTIVTTAATGFMAGKYFTSPLTLWSIALFNGLLSGCLAEVSRRFMVRAFDRFETMTKIAHIDIKSKLAF